MALNQHEFYAPRWVNLNRQGWVNLNRPRWVSLNQPRWVNIPVFSTAIANDKYDHASHYSYDIHGNVKNMLQDNRKLATNTIYAGFTMPTEQFKRLDYSYDLISGNVHEVSYEGKNTGTGKNDQWHHKYAYDADNRITKVATSDDEVIWDTDGKYFYYAHGPLARTEVGQDKVQGSDYAYTLQGWIKGVNSNSLVTKNDIGQDAVVSTDNHLFAKDVYGYTLNYFNSSSGSEDFQPIDPSKWTTVANRFEADKTGSDLLASTNNLFNGNIGAMVTTITDPTTGTALPNGMGYTYDQLNRLRKSRGYNNIDNVSTSPTFNTWGTGSTYANRYYNEFTYDANGNIETQKRHDDIGTQIEDMTYKYNKQSSLLLQNRLYHVKDNVTAAAFTDDIDDQGTFDGTEAGIKLNNNYKYDAEGRLVQDLQEEISKIEWRVDGKVSAVYRPLTSLKKNLKFDYDAMGNRIAKHVYHPSGVWESSTYYVRDAQGNVMAVYSKKVDATLFTDSYKITERDIYGSSRLGMNTTQIELVSAIPISAIAFQEELGLKQYELSNHLGNVLSVVSDKKRPVDDGVYDSNGDGINDLSTPSLTTADGIIDYYTADIVSATDYYPFGIEMSSRSFSSPTYRYGFNGMEKDDEMNVSGGSYTTFYREFDTRLGRWLSIDPKISGYESVYVSMGNNPIWHNDILGDKFDKKSQKRADAFRAKVKERQSEVFNKLEEKRKSLTSYSVDPESGLHLISFEPDAEYKELEKQFNELNSARDELDFMEESSQKCKIRNNYKQPGGLTSYNRFSNTLVFHMNKDADYSSLGHELKHGFQFLTADISFRGLFGRILGDIRSINNEVEAYQRQYALNPNFVKGKFESDPDLKIQFGKITITKMSDLSAKYVSNLLDDYRGLPNRPKKEEARKKMYDQAKGLKVPTEYLLGF